MIGCTKLEGEAMTTKAGKPPSMNDDAVCDYLSEGKCSVYDQRPAICRLFGSTEKLMCPHGCVPDRVLPEIESMKILDEIDKLSDGHMYSNVSKQQAINLRLGRSLSAPLSSSTVKNALDIIPFKKKD
jgi:Fe-S-cluster containining protein